MCPYISGVGAAVGCMLAEHELTLLSGCGLQPREGYGGGREGRGIVVHHGRLIEQTRILWGPR